MPVPLAIPRRIAAVVRIVAISAILAGGGGRAAAQETPRIPRVRPDNAVIAAAIAQGTERSKTFRQLIDAIDATDGLVYVEEGPCGHSVRSCLHLSVQISGPYRVLRILVNPRKAAGCELTASIGHELQHALEALSDRSVRSTKAIFHFFSRIGPTGSDTFETSAAQRVDSAVWTEACRR